MVDPFLETALPLVFAHLLTDFAFQSDQSVRVKNKFPNLIRHGLGAGLLSYLFLGVLTGWLVPLGIAVSHTLLDAWKLRTKRGTRLYRFVIDQLGHLLIVVLISWAAAYAPDRAVSLWPALFGPGYLVVLAFLSGAILAVYGGSFIVELTFETLGIKGDGGSTAAGEGKQDNSEEIGMVSGGRVIGYLERGLIFTFILAGYPAGIGFLVAAKSVFRFGELTDSKRRSQAEYIIIGTLLSILFGTLVAYSTDQIIKLINP